jgi:RNA polymerase sigma factor for flagellar operon FliA
MQLTSMKQLAQGLEVLLKKLPEKEQLVMALHYQEELSFRDVATVLNLTPGRVSQLHTQAMIRIRAGMKKGA